MRKAKDSKNYRDRRKVLKANLEEENKKIGENLDLIFENSIENRRKYQ